MRRALGLALLFAVALVGTPAQAGPPTDQLRTATDRVLKVLQDPELQKPARTEERRRQIREVANQIFDWQETGKRALARHWQGRTPAQREEFSQVFAELVERSYVGKLEQYSGEKILYTGESLDSDQATVRTKLVTKAGTEIPIDYRMLKEGDRWRVYDVTIEGVSLVANYRSQFNRIVQQSGFDELMKKLKTKQDELVFEEAERGKKKP
jgi:phospholipid transport system substrate-binding protein